jgi:hypothetical protein
MFVVNAAKTLNIEQELTFNQSNDTLTSLVLMME